MKKNTEKELIRQAWRRRMHEIIFESDTPAGKWFDILLLWAIIISSVTVMLESVGSINLRLGQLLAALELLFTILFTVEYICRIISAGRTLSYIFSFFGIIDFLAVLPTYTAFFVGGMKYLIVVRTFRLLRVFRIFKLSRYLREGAVLLAALAASRFKIILFLGVVFTIVITMGTLMYVVEGAGNGFTSIPLSIYWAIVTLTTVGYGDIAPKTFVGQAISSLVMILGYAIIAVPTGIVTAELSRTELDTSECSRCGHSRHHKDARYCSRCGKKLSSQPVSS